MKSNKTTVIAAAIVTTLVSVPVMAKPQHKKDVERAAAVGMGTGVVVGSLVAGPAGAAVAGIIGAFIGKDTAQEKALNASHQSLSDSQQELVAMRQAFAELQHDAQLKATPVAYTEEKVEQVLALQSAIQFKTGSYAIEPVYEDQLALVANALKRHPQLQVRLTGHADNRGDAKYNQALSMQRALSIKSHLTAQGAAQEQILTVALGEQNSQADSMEAAFFDRKVVLEIADDQEVLTAQR